MKKYEFRDVCYYESADYHALFDNAEDLEQHVSAIIKCFLRRRLFRELLHIYSDATALSGYAFLHAHGRWEREWRFSDGRKRHKVQDFIDRLDGECAAVFLKCCNPWNLEIHSKKSIVVHADRTINIVDIVGGWVMRIYVPGWGYLDSGYELKRAIENFG